nr:MAG TPA: hypothetical protein [Caudoviricetes sp.]
MIKAGFSLYPYILSLKGRGKSGATIIILKSLFALQTRTNVRIISVR